MGGGGFVFFVAVYRFYFLGNGGEQRGNIGGIVSNKSAVTSKDVWGNGGEIVGNCRQY
jgi:hypothetical protein